MAKKNKLFGKKNDGDETIDLSQMEDRRKTPEICLTAVKQDGRALEHVPENLRSAELCLTAIQNSLISVREWVPEQLWWDKKFALAAVEKDGEALECVPENLRSAKICRAAVKQYGGALKHVPEELKTPELCLIAVKGNEGAIEAVPRSIKKSVAAKARVYPYAGVCVSHIVFSGPLRATNELVSGLTGKTVDCKKSGALRWNTFAANFAALDKALGTCVAPLVFKQRLAAKFEPSSDMYIDRYDFSGALENYFEEDEDRQKGIHLTFYTRGEAALGDSDIDFNGTWEFYQALSEKYPQVKMTVLYRTSDNWMWWYHLCVYQVGSVIEKDKAGGEDGFTRNMISFQGTGEMLDEVFSKILVFRDGEKKLPVTSSNFGKEFTVQFPQGAEIDFLDLQENQDIYPGSSTGNISFAEFRRPFYYNPHYRSSAILDSMEGSLLGFCEGLTARYDDPEGFKIDFTTINPEDFSLENFECSGGSSVEFGDDDTIEFDLDKDTQRFPHKMEGEGEEGEDEDEDYDDDDDEDEDDEDGEDDENEDDDDEDEDDAEDEDDDDPPKAVPPKPARFCSECGAALTPGAKFCSQCGAKV